MRSLPRGLIGFIIVALVFAVTVIVTHNVLTEPYPGHNDFLSRWEGARSFWVDGLNSYGEKASLNIQMRIFGRAAVEGEDPGYFAYPFYTAILISPLAYLPYAWASAIWMVLLEALLIASLFLLFDLFHWKPAPWLLGLLVIWVLAFYFSARGLILGQPGVAVYFLELLALWGLSKNRDTLAGVALAISTVKPQMGFLIVPFFLVWALRRRRWKFMISFSASLTLLLLISFLLQPSWLGDWIAQLRLYPSYTALGSPVWIITHYYLGLGDWAEALAALVLVALLFIISYRLLWGGHSETFAWAAVLTLTVTHLIAPRTATPHYVVFIIPLVFYCAEMARRYRRRGNLLIALILLALLVLPWLHFLATVVGEFEHPTVYLPLPLGMLVLLWGTRRLWWQRAPLVEAKA